MSRAVFWNAVYFVLLLVSVTAQQQQQLALNRTLASTPRNGHTRQQQSESTAGRLRFNFRQQGGVLSAIGLEQLNRIKARSGFDGSLAALAAQLDTDDDLVGAGLMQPSAPVPQKNTPYI
jgi:hypothetical protein